MLLYCLPASLFRREASLALWVMGLYCVSNGPPEPGSLHYVNVCVLCLPIVSETAGWAQGKFLAQCLSKSLSLSLPLYVATSQMTQNSYSLICPQEFSPLTAFTGSVVYMTLKLSGNKMCDLKRRSASEKSWLFLSLTYFFWPSAIYDIEPFGFLHTSVELDIDDS